MQVQDRFIKSYLYFFQQFGGLGSTEISVGIRVSEEEEEEEEYNGINVCEFGLHAYPEFVERQGA